MELNPMSFQDWNLVVIDAISTLCQANGWWWRGSSPKLQAVSTKGLLLAPMRYRLDQLLVFLLGQRLWGREGNTTDGQLICLAR